MALCLRPAVTWVPREEEDDNEPFVEKFPRLLRELEVCFGEGEGLTAEVLRRLGKIGNAK